MTTRDETVWDRDARAALVALIAYIDTDAMEQAAADLPYDSAKMADALAAERAKRGGADVVAEGERRVVRETLGATANEWTEEAARRVVRERDAAREVAATLTAERDEARAERDAARRALDAEVSSALDWMRKTRGTLGAIGDESIDDAAKRVVKDRDAALSRAEQAERALAEVPGEALVEAARKVRERAAASPSSDYYAGVLCDNLVRDAHWSLEAACAISDLVRAACSTPAPAPFDASGLKVGDRVRLKDAKVVVTGLGGVTLVINDGDDNPSRVSVWHTAIAAKVSP